MVNARSALRLVFWVWLVETGLSLCVRLIVGAAASHPATSILLAMTFVGAAFVPIAILQGLGAFVLTRSPAGRWTATAAGTLFVVHSALIATQLIASLFANPASSQGLLTGLGVSLAVVRIVAWGLLAVSIGAIARHARIAIGSGLEMALTGAFGAVVALSVVNVRFARTEASWATATLVVNLLANLFFLVLVARVRRGLPASGWIDAEDALPLRLTGIASAFRGTLLFLVVMMGSAAGSAGLSVVSLVLPALSAFTGILVAIGWALLWRRSAGLARASVLGALICGLGAIALDTTTSVQLWQSITRKAPTAALSLGGFGLIGNYLASLLWLQSLVFRARAAGSSFASRAAAVLVGLQVAVALIGFVAWRTLSETPAPKTGVALVVAAAWLALGTTLAGSALSQLLAQKSDQSA